MFDVKSAARILIFAVFSSSLLPQTPDARAASVREHLRKAAEDFKNNDIHAAAAEFNEVLVLQPQNVEAYANLGVIAFAQRDYSTAAANLEHALSLDPSQAKAEALLGMCERKLASPSAQKHLTHSFQSLEDRNLKIQTGLELANLDYQNGDFDEAAAVMRTLVAIDPDNVEILYMAQHIYSELADDTLNKIAIIAPDSARMQQIIAQHLVNQGDLKTAVAHYQKALEINAHLPGVHFELAEATLEMAPNDAKAQSNAQKELKDAMAAEGDNAAIECMFARIAARQTDANQAYEHYRRALALNPGSTEAQVGVARILSAKGQPEQAAKLLRAALQSDPLNEQAHYWLANVCKRLNLGDESQKEFKLYREVKEAKQRLQDLFRQMNRKSATSGDVDSASEIKQ